MSPCKRLIMTVGDSRVGKSTVIRLLIDLLCSQGKRIRAYDHDNRRKLDSYKYFIPVESINFNGGTDQILEEIKNGYDAIAIDMPGQQIDRICEYMDNVNLFKVLTEVGWQLTFVQPISHRLDCLEYLEQLLAFAEDKADYVVVKNQHFDQKFQLYQNSSYSQLMTLGGTDIILDELNKYSYEAIERLGCPYSQAISSISIYSVYRAYVYKWIKNFHQSILNNSIAQRHLGLLQINQEQEQRHDDF
ncbi:hypothetical protein IQ243_25995 [Nostocales cyanobacterium LEGE 11386]|nr:hypothetical protein [Nostocales cyanobacterium LEGE 11386]